jgi:mRNA interferase MazF
VVTPRRGEVVLVDFGPPYPAEAAQARPAVVVTNDAANVHGTSVVVVPLTSNVASVYPFQVFIAATRSGLKRDSKAQVELLRSVARRRLRRRLGALPPDLLLELDAALRLHLGLT